VQKRNELRTTIESKFNMLKSQFNTKYGRNDGNDKQEEILRKMIVNLEHRLAVMKKMKYGKEDRQSTSDSKAPTKTKYSHYGMIQRPI